MNTTIVFDLDDTLYRECDFVRSGIRSVDTWARSQLGVSGFAETAIRLWNEGRRERLFDATLAALGMAADPAAIAAMVAVYRDHLPRIQLAPDARDFLASDHGFSLALVSDGFGITQRHKAAALGLSGHAFDPIIFTDDWGEEFWKPHRRAFEAIEAAHRDRSSRFVYVADNPAKDFLAPRALGWATVQIDRPGAIHSRTPPSERHRADMRIRSLRDLTRQRVESLFGSLVERLSA